MSDKTCTECRHARREQTGPHEYLHSCALHQRDFPEADDCAAYHPGASGQHDDGEFWPVRQGWEVTT